MDSDTEYYGSAAEDDPERRAFRSKLRSMVEEYATTHGSEGVITSWGLVAILSSHDAEDSCPVEEIWVDFAEFNDYTPPLWRGKALFRQAADEINRMED